MDDDENKSARIPIHNISWRQHCKKCCVSSPDFMKIVDIINTGIGIYYDSTRDRRYTKNDEPTKTRENRSEELAYILHNKGDKVDTPKGLKFVIEPSIVKCPRCRRYLENAQKLLQNVTNIDKDSVLGICGYCKNRIENYTPCNRCIQAVDRFLEFKELEKKTVTWNETPQKSESVPVKFEKRFCLCGLAADDDDSLYKTRSEQCVQRDITFDLCIPEPEEPEPEPEPPKPVAKKPIKKVKVIKTKPPKEPKVQEVEIPFPRRPRREIVVEKLKRISTEIFSESTPTTCESMHKLSVECVECDVVDSHSQDVCLPKKPVRHKHIHRHTIVSRKNIPKLNDKQLKVEKNIASKAKGFKTRSKSLKRKASKQDATSGTKSQKDVKEHSIQEQSDTRSVKEKESTEHAAKKKRKGSSSKDRSTSDREEASVSSGKKRRSSSKAERSYESTDGIFTYALSDKGYIERGWTKLPTEKVVRQMYMYRVQPSRPEFDWFEHNKTKGEMSYDTGEKLAELDPKGHGQWFYKNGRVALDYYDKEDLHSQQRVIVYSSGEADERGRTQPITILGIFDFLGNGVVFDHAGKIRLKYNQTEGVLLDKTIGPFTKWKWHSLNDAANLKHIMVDTQLLYKNPDIMHMGKFDMRKEKNQSAEHQMLTVEHENFIREKKKAVTKVQNKPFKPFDIKFKAVKINDNFSLNIIDQTNVRLVFREGKTNLKLNLGMVLDNNQIIDTTTAEVGQVDVAFEHSSTRDAIIDLQNMVNKAKQYGRNETDRKLRIQPPVATLSVDRMNAIKSTKPPLPLLTSAAEVTNTIEATSFYMRRKPTCIPVYCFNTMNNTRRLANNIN